MSSFVHQSRVEAPKDALRVAFFGFWPAACILLSTTACYFGPIEYVPVNDAPTILSQPAPNGDVLIVNTQGFSPFVVVADDDFGPISYEWELSEDGYMGQGRIDQKLSPDGLTVIRQWSILDLDSSAHLDGQELSWTIRDAPVGVGEDRVAWQLELVWPLEVP